MPQQGTRAPCAVLLPTARLTHPRTQEHPNYRETTRPPPKTWRFDLHTRVPSAHSESDEGQGQKTAPRLIPSQCSSLAALAGLDETKIVLGNALLMLRETGRWLSWLSGANRQTWLRWAELCASVRNRSVFGKGDAPPCTTHAVSSTALWG